MLQSSFAEDYTTPVNNAFHRTHTFNPLGQSTGTVNATSGVVQTLVDADGNTVAVIDEDGNVTSYVLDALSRQVETIEPNGAVATTTYDAAGNVTKVVDPDSRTITYAYNADNRETGETWLSSSSSVLNVLTFTYDHKGNQLTAANSAGTITYTYDALERVATRTDIFGLVTTYSYNATNEQTSMQDSLGGTLTAVYDSPAAWQVSNLAVRDRHRRKSTSATTARTS